MVTKFALDGWKTANGHLVGNENWDVWADVNGDGSLKSRYLRGDEIDQVFARYDKSGIFLTVNWELTDRMGSVRDVINNAALVQDSIAYGGFGNITAETDYTKRGRYAWTGRELDVETGLQFNRARYYDSGTGRWMTQDPLGFDAGDSNLYRYVRNRGTVATDPSGLEGWGLWAPGGLDGPVWMGPGPAPGNQPPPVKSKFGGILEPVAAGDKFSIVYKTDGAEKLIKSGGFKVTQQMSFEVKGYWERCIRFNRNGPTLSWGGGEIPTFDGLWRTLPDGIKLGRPHPDHKHETGIWQPDHGGGGTFSKGKYEMIAGNAVYWDAPNAAHGFWGKARDALVQKYGNPDEKERLLKQVVVIQHFVTTAYQQDGPFYYPLVRVEWSSTSTGGVPSVSIDNVTPLKSGN